MAIPSIAANAYQTAARLGRQASSFGENASDTSSTSGVSFGSMVNDAVNSVVDKGRTTDAKEIGMVDGKAGVVDVVTAVAETEVALQTMVAVRDRVISAYQEIMRMSI